MSHTDPRYLSKEFRATCTAHGWASRLIAHADYMDERTLRWLDLLRYCRHTLHLDGLISDDEFAELAKDHPAVARLEGYDEMKQRAEKAEALVKEHTDEKWCFNPEHETQEALVKTLVDALRKMLPRVRHLDCRDWDMEEARAALTLAEAKAPGAESREQCR